MLVISCYRTTLGCFAERSGTAARMGKASAFINTSPIVKSRNRQTFSALVLVKKPFRGGKA